MSNIDGQAGAKPSSRKSRRGRRILGLILFMLVLLLATVSFFLVKMILPKGQIKTGKDAGGIQWVRSIYGWGASEKEQLFTPGSVAIGPDGTIWSTSPQNAAVVGFRPDGTYKGMLNGGKDKFLNPTDIAVDPDGRIYVAENTLDKVHVMSPDNRQLLSIKIQSPTSVAASKDRIVVGSAAGFAILDKEGTPIKVVGSNGKGKNQFDGVNGIAIDEQGRIFVTDTYNNRLSAYDRQGNRLWIIETGNPGNEADLRGADKMKVAIKQEAKLQLPLELTMDANGRLIVVDPFDFGVTILNRENGKLIAKYGAYGTVDGQMYYPSGIDYDPQRDWFAVADTGNNRLQVFRLPGSGSSAAAALQRSFAGPIRACLIPLLLLLVALIIAAVRRRQRKAADAAEPASVPSAA